MNSRSVLLVTAVVALSSVACFRFKEEAMTVTDDAGDATSAVDSGTPATDAVVETAPTLCDNYGGFATAQKAAAATMTKITTDCRIDRFFLAMTADQKTHMQECLALQFGSIMRCSRDGVRVKYPNVDSKGVQCKDMRGSHQSKGLAIFAEDFDAFIDDAVSSLAEQKISTEDLAAIADVLKFERTDIQNPIADAGRDGACLPEGGTADTGAVDTGPDDY